MSELNERVKRLESSMREKKLPDEYISKALEVYRKYIFAEEEIEKKYSDKKGGFDDRGEEEKRELTKRLRKDIEALEPLKKGENQNGEK